MTSVARRQVCSNFASIRIPTPHELEAGEDEYPQVEPQAPVFYVPKVTIDPLLHQFEMRVSPRKPLTCAQPVSPGFTCCRNAYLAISLV